MSIELTKDHLIIDGKKTLIYGGDLPYCRIPRRLWKERIMQMKNAGMNTITFYTLWEWHQQADKRFDFSGEKDIGHFLSLIAECGMYCIFRLGPFVHGEFRNGGLPQWLIDELGDKVRTNDPQYLDYAGAWYDELLKIAEPYLHTNNGPIILLQLENELGSAGCKGDDLARGSADSDENTRHLLFFYNKVRSRGIDLPLVDINHIPDKEKYIGNFVDTGGFYPVSCFNCDGELCDFDQSSYASRQRPKITIETGGGMFVRYFDTPAYRNTNSFQGPLVKPEIIDGCIVYHLAEGCSGINFYMFCDGQNPDNCNESMIPAKNLNFQAPITVAGRLRESYFASKLRGWFFRSFEQEILGSSPDECWAQVRSCGTAHPGAENSGDLFKKYGDIAVDDNTQENAPVLSAARTTTGLNLSESNFLFIRNVFNTKQEWLRDIKVVASPSKLACEVWHEYPKKIQMEMPPGTMKIMPFFVRLCRKNFLEYSTCELLDRRDFNGKTQVVFYESDEVMSEIRLIIPDTQNIKSCGNVLILRESPNTVTLLAKAERSPICVETDDLRIMLVTKKYAEKLWDTGDTFAWSSAVLGGSMQEVSVITEKNDFCMELFTPRKPLLHSSQLRDCCEFFDAERSIYRLNGKFDFAPPAIDWHKEYDQDNIILTAGLTDSMLHDAEDIIFTLRHDGMVSKAFWNGKLISDHAFGRFLEWEIPCREFLNGSGTLQIIAERASYCDIESAVRKKFLLKFD